MLDHRLKGWDVAKGTLLVLRLGPSNRLAFQRSNRQSSQLLRAEGAHTTTKLAFTTCSCAQEYAGKAGDVLDNVFFVVSGIVEARLTKPGKQVRYY